MSIIPLARSRHGAAKDDETDRETWEREMAAFPQRVRSEAANLAAHSWDVTIIGERVLISCAWYRPEHQGFYHRDGNLTPLTAEEMDRLYPRTDFDRPSKRACNEHGVWRSYTIQTETFA